MAPPPARTLLHYIMDVLREVRGQVDTAKVYQGLQDALKEIDQKGNYTFMQTDRNLSIIAPYSTGTIAGQGGSNAIVGTGTAWDAIWTLRTLVFGGRLEYPIVTFIDATHLATRDLLSGTEVFTGQPYTIYANRYLLPDDCEPGRDIVLKGASQYGYNGEIRKMPRALHERRRMETVGSSPMQWYTDGDLDETTGRATIMLYPYPSVATELRLLYYRSFTIPNLLSNTIALPKAFERLPILLAAAIVMQREGMAKWLEKHQLAMNMLTDLYNRHAAAASYDLQVEVGDYEGNLQGDMFQDSTLYTRGW